MIVPFVNADYVLGWLLVSLLLPGHFYYDYKVTAAGAINTLLFFLINRLKLTIREHFT